jgi:hypothetical protein
MVAAGACFAFPGDAAAAAAAPGLPGEATARKGKGAALECKVKALAGEARGGAALEGAAVRLSALEVLLPAAMAAPRASGIQSSLSTPSPPPSSHDECIAVLASDREGSKRAGGGERSAPSWA